MSTIRQIPLLAGTPQRFSISLGGTTYQLDLKFRSCLGSGFWTIDILTAQGVPIIQGMALATGANLLAQYPYINWGGGLYVQTLSNPDAVPTFENLGVDGLLYWVT